MALFSKLDRPVFIKEDSDSETYIKKLEELKKRASSEVLEKIEKEIKIASIGLFGENNIAFELKNSGMPLYIIRDLHLEIGDLSAQIDFAVVTRKMTFIIECKNLIGDIEIDNNGNFIRTYEYKNNKIREGIYSPITQNARHLDVLKLIKKDSQSNVLMKLAIDKLFNNYHKSVVVLANPKTILNAKDANKDIKNQVIRADQLVKFIKDTINNSKETASNDEDMLAFANRLLSLHTKGKTDYTLKFEKLIESFENDLPEPVMPANTQKTE